MEERNIRSFGDKELLDVLQLMDDASDEEIVAAANELPTRDDYRAAAKIFITGIEPADLADSVRDALLTIREIDEAI